MFSKFYRKIFTEIFAGLFLSLSFAVPVLVLAQNPVPPVTGTAVQTGQARGTIFGITYECQQQVNGAVKEGVCTFDDLVQATLNVIRWGRNFALGFSIVVIAWAGFNYMISGSNAKKRTDANRTLIKAVIGIAYIIGAWLIITLITSALGVNVGVTTLTNNP